MSPVDCTSMCGKINREFDMAAPPQHYQPPPQQQQSDPCAAPAAAAAVARGRAVASFRATYQRQLWQLVHRVHETPLCLRIVAAMRRGAMRVRSSSLVMTPPSPSLVRRSSVNACAGGHEKAHCRFCQPLDGDLGGSGEDLSQTLLSADGATLRPPMHGSGAGSAPVADSTASCLPSDPKTPAFLAMLLMAFPLSSIFPDFGALQNRNAPLAAALVSTWATDHLPLLVRSEVAAMRTQLDALVKTVPLPIAATAGIASDSMGSFASLGRDCCAATPSSAASSPVSPAPMVAADGTAAVANHPVSSHPPQPPPVVHGKVGVVVGDTLAAAIGVSNSFCP
ncbi:hypothetical protein BC828DRAFT_69808 [Blastocladiella britannica]|nr:hypothetical protein BC828DRAFT_69808 [Blastocladiella britannica]